MRSGAGGTGAASGTGAAAGADGADGADAEGIERLRRRWRGLVEISEASGDPRRAGLAAAGAVLVRPDGHIGFRTSADSAGLGALDSHLDSYLIPASA